jgi:hypothetical protein
MIPNELQRVTFDFARVFAHEGLISTVQNLHATLPLVARRCGYFKHSKKWIY